MAKNVTPHEHNSLFFPLLKAHAEYRCVYIVRVMATRAPVAQNKPHVDHAAVTWFLFFPRELHRSCNQGCVLYWTGKHAAHSGSGPNNIQPPSGPSPCGLRFCPPRVLESRLLSSICRFSSFVCRHRYGRAKLFCSV